MANSQRLILAFVFILLSSSVFAQSSAGTEIANIQSWLTTTDGQLAYQPKTGSIPATESWSRSVTVDGRYINATSKADYTASNGRTYQIMIEKIGEIDGAKVGKAVGRMARVLGPVALGLEVMNLVCELSDICKKSDANDWEYYKDGISATDAEATGWCSQDRTVTLKVCMEQYSNCGFERLGGTSNLKCTNFHLHPNSNLSLLYDIQNSAGSTIAMNQTKSRLSPFDDIPAQTRIPTDEDWMTAETKLNDPRFDEPLLVNGQPVPLANLPIFGNNPPIKLEESDTVNKDDQGNVTGTTHRTRELQLSDGATASKPGAVNGTEIETKTDYNSSGTPTGTSTKTDTSPPPEKPFTISFDAVDDVPLEQQTITANLQPSQSWGEGACPGNVTVNTHYGAFTFDYQPTCDFASAIRPAVIFMASISALFIVTGYRHKD